MESAEQFVLVRFELFLFKAAYFAEGTKLAEQLKVKFSLLLQFMEESAVVSNLYQKYCIFHKENA